MSSVSVLAPTIKNIVSVRVGNLEYELDKTAEDSRLFLMGHCRVIKITMESSIKS